MPTADPARNTTSAEGRRLSPCSATALHPTRSKRRRPQADFAS
ncbi:hypothetical protein [Lysobacter gummosus]